MELYFFFQISKQFKWENEIKCSVIWRYKKVQVSDVRIRMSFYWLSSPVISLESEINSTIHSSESHCYKRCDTLLASYGRTYSVDKEIFTSQVFSAVGAKVRVQLASLLYLTFNPVTVCSGTNDFRSQWKAHNRVGQKPKLRLSKWMIFSLS